MASKRTPTMVYLDPEVRAVLEERAAAAGESLSHYCRRALTQHAWVDGQSKGPWPVVGVVENQAQLAATVNAHPANREVTSRLKGGK
jgi:hypothetical protein